MSVLLPSAPAPPPPPPNPPQLSTVAQQSAEERQRTASAQGAGSDGTDITGGQGVKPPNTTANPGGSTAPKTQLGG